MPPRGRPRAFDHDEALDAAMTLFWRKGFSATSMTELCAAMGINAPSLYAAFGSKEKLYATVVARYAERAAPLIWGHMEDAPTAHDAVAGLLLASACQLVGNCRPAGCMVTLSSVGQEGEHRLGALVAQARADGVEMLLSRLERGVRDGDVPAHADLLSIARFYICVQNGMSIQARDGASTDALRDIARCALAAWPALMGAVNPCREETAPAPPAPPGQ